VADTKVVDPPGDIASQFVDDAAHVTSPAAGRDLTYPYFESLLGFAGPDDLAVAAQLEAQFRSIATRPGRRNRNKAQWRRGAVRLFMTRCAALALLTITMKSSA